MESEEKLLHEGLISYISENYQTAKVEFEKLVKIKPSEPSYLLYTGNCELKLKNYEAALDLYNSALKLSPESSFNINYSKGIACFYLNKFVDSRICFTDAIKETKDPKQLGMIFPWMNKLDVELKESGIIDYNSANTKELKIITNWIQNNETITVEITSNQNLNDYLITFNSKEIVIQNKSDEKIKHTMNLTNSIIPDKSSFKINGMKAELSLFKEVPNFNWVTLEVEKAPTNVKSGGYYPSSSKVKKDWSVFDKEYDEGVKQDMKNSGGNEGMWNLFRQIYERADENTRRAMVKSFQTSSGTVLSTSKIYSIYEFSFFT